MSTPIQITTVDDPRVAVFSRLTEAQLRNRLDPSAALFVAESPKVITTALDVGLTPTALLCEQKHLEGDAAPLVARCPEMPVFTGSREVLSALTGYTLTRGVLCAFRRPQPRSVAEVCRTARRVVVLDGVTDSTNVGAMFRSVAALGTDAVVLTPTTCDPLNRRALRVSMGTALRVPWAVAHDALAELRALGFRTAAMALHGRSVGIDHPALVAEPRLALIMGTEGDGLDDAVIDAADYVVKIPMAYGIDSLNVAAAAAIACWELRPR